MTSLAKLKKGSSSSYYNESSSTLEKLSILKAWAEVYIVSMKDDAYIRSKEPLTTLPTSNKAADSRSGH